MQDSPPKPTPRRQEERVRATRAKLIGAAIEALDRHGYGATSISVVQTGAGVSRGALMHHFATRNALMLATAQHLLQAAIRPTRAAGRHAAQGDLRGLMRYYWRRVVNTREGRAFVEILIASRTDPDLQEALGPLLAEWDAEIAAAARARFAHPSGDPEAAALLWSIARAFLRGLIVHRRFVDDPAHMERMIDQFADLMAGQLAIIPQPEEA